MAQIKKEKYLEYLLKKIKPSKVYISTSKKAEKNTYEKYCIWRYKVFYDVSTGWMRIVDI